MIILLSPAKTFSKNLIPSLVDPVFKREASVLQRALKRVPFSTIQTSMKLSDSLLEDVKTYIKHFGKESFQAISTYEGQAFKAFDVRSLDKDAYSYMQNHLYILSGMYGLLRPSDGINLYRLEMQDKTIKNLYTYWKPKIKNYLLTYHHHELFINLASKEYQMVIDDQLSYVTIHFYERHQGELKQLSMMVKTMRGLFARYLIMHQVETLDSIKQIIINDYHYDQDLSDDHNLVFIKEVYL
jgi:cytoplasmic iron level regulating protein YaaA (DUF328/UPF0246 family)